MRLPPVAPLLKGGEARARGLRDGGRFLRGENIEGRGPPQGSRSLPRGLQIDGGLDCEVDRASKLRTLERKGQVVSLDPDASPRLTTWPASRSKRIVASEDSTFTSLLVELERRVDVGILLQFGLGCLALDLVERLVPLFSVPAYSYFLRKVSV